MTGLCPKPNRGSSGQALGMPFAIVAAVVDSPKLYELKSATVHTLITHFMLLLISVTFSACR